jgi:hypothetical protein
MFREESGAVGLSGRDLQAAQALSGHANVVARAGEYEASGAFPGQTTSSLQALAFLHLLNGVTAKDAIAFARAATAEPPNSSEKDEDGGHDEDAGGKGQHGAASDPADAACDSGNHGDNEGPDGNGDEPSDGDDLGDGEDPGGGGPGNGDGGPVGGESHSALPEVTVPLATLRGLAARAGENRLLGPLDPAMARDLAAAAARSPHSRWEVTIVDAQGYAVGHGIASSRRGNGEADGSTRSRRPRTPLRYLHE